MDVMGVCVCCTEYGVRYGWETWRLGVGWIKVRVAVDDGREELGPSLPLRSSTAQIGSHLAVRKEGAGGQWPLPYLVLLSP
jgi:hypothetical protein